MNAAAATAAAAEETEDPVVGELRPRLMSRDPSGINLARRPSVSAECVTMNPNGDAGSPTVGSGRLHFFIRACIHYFSFLVDKKAFKCMSLNMHVIHYAATQWW